MKEHQAILLAAKLNFGAPPGTHYEVAVTPHVSPWYVRRTVDREELRDLNDDDPSEPGPSKMNTL